LIILITFGEAYNYEDHYAVLLMETLGILAGKRHDTISLSFLIKQRKYDKKKHAVSYFL
jgi:hypothetical protein